MPNNPQNGESNRLNAMLKKLSASVQKVVRGNYGAASQLFKVAASESETPELRELAETLGLMSVKVEGREFHLEQVLADLKQKNEELCRNIDLRTESGFLFCFIVFLLCIYAFALSLITFTGLMSDVTEGLMTLGLMLVVSAFMGIFIRRHRHRYSWAAWGLTWKGSGHAVWESMLFSVPVALGCIALKWMLIQNPGAPQFGHPLFEPLSSPLIICLYALSAVAQEVISRGFLQTSLERILTGKYRALMAVATVALLFSVAHLHYTIPTMLSTLAGGLFFGWLFYRHRTLVGVSLVHFLLGILLVDILRLMG